MKNRDRELKKMKKWRDKNKEYFINYNIVHSESKRIHAMNRRAAEINVNENYTEEQLQITLKEFGHKCFNCCSTSNITIDHHYPLSKGFPLSLSNAVVLCQSCNSSKNNKLPQDFYNEKKLAKLERKLKNIHKNYNKK